MEEICELVLWLMQLHYINVINFPDWFIVFQSFRSREREREKFIDIETKSILIV